MKKLYELMDGTLTDFETAVMLMDDEIREEIHGEFAPCSEEKFLAEYCARHFEKYGKHFTV